MKKKVTFAFYVLLSLLLADLVIVLASLAQIALEGRTGEWHPFWLWQAKIIIDTIS